MRPDFRRIVFHAASPFRPFWIDGLREGGGRRSKVFRGVCACMSLSRSGRVPAGGAEIVFTYHTPGLALSAGVCLTGLAVYAGYLLLLHFKRKRKQNADPC